jgi:hypothetical protein
LGAKAKGLDRFHQLFTWVHMGKELFFTLYRKVFLHYNGKSLNRKKGAGGLKWTSYSYPTVFIRNAANMTQLLLKASKINNKTENLDSFF